MGKKYSKPSQTTNDEQSFANWISASMRKRRKGGIGKRKVIVTGSNRILRQSSTGVEGIVSASFNNANISNINVDSAHYEGPIYEHNFKEDGEHVPEEYIQRYLESIGNMACDVNNNLQAEIKGGKNLVVSNRYDMNV